MKTLKDIGKSERECCSIVEGYNNICEMCIKPEAIKRVKDCCPNDNVGGRPLRKAEYCGGCKRDIWFNNLIEEDLK